MHKKGPAGWVPGQYGLTPLEATQLSREIRLYKTHAAFCRDESFHHFNVQCYLHRTCSGSWCVQFVPYPYHDAFLLH